VAQNAHRWENLYEVPTDSQFLSVFYSTGMQDWRKCLHCNAVGKLRLNGKIQVTPARKWDKKKAGAKKWSENLSQWKESQIQSR
jgi:hypothetical protein